MRNIEESRRIAANVLAMCKNIQPDFWAAAANPNMCNAWAIVLGSEMLPEQCFYEGVTLFYRTHTGDARPSVGDVIACARAIRDRWESHPVKRRELKRLREARRDARDRALAAGTYQRALEREIVHIEQ
ncbi:hypothetical protein QP222_05530 [Corynebacterium pyruviciproducens]|uniref:hypothetical protein n=1 Tax=Corynebacterium pyruviciproducens TaxID=598660 RepID=UPI00254F62D1|nr:hypothetical protein [Corynebacterium pyruviciproducens]MDK6565869.1 hypothetical protein [Corynebacterium pyruviciproducens]